MIDNELILEIRNKSDIVDVIGSYIPLIKKGKNFFGVCPFHDDTNPSMSVSKEKQIYTCFSCGATGNVITFVMNYEKVSYKEALKILANRLGIDLKISTEPKVIEKPYKIYDTLTKYYQNNLNTAFGINAKKYLTKRKIDEDLIKTFEIGLSLNSKDEATKLLNEKGFEQNELVELGITNFNEYGYHDIFSNRIIFPLWNINGKVIGYSGRIYDDSDDSKYVNTKETLIFKKGLNLYNYHRAKENVREEKKIIIMEGFLDVIRAYSVGIKNVVATMGTAVTKEQVNLIKKLSNDVYLCFDSDSAGEKATIACGNELIKQDINPKIIRLEEGDPDSYIIKYGKEKFQEKLNNYISFIDFKIEYFKKDFNFNNSEDITKYIKIITNEINLIHDEVLLELTLNKISKLVNVSIDTLKKLINNETKIEENYYIAPKRKKIIDKYEKAERIFLYFMLNDENIIIKYKNSINFLPSVNYRYLLQEIIDFYEKYKTINIADFITFLGDKKDLIDALGPILEVNYDNEYSVLDIEDYIYVLKEYGIKKEIMRLTKMLKEELDYKKQIDLGKKITDLKIRSEENDNRNQNV